MSIKFSLLTVETDSNDPGVLAALRQLLERAGAGVVVVPQAANAAASVETKAPDPEPNSAASETSTGDLRNAAQELGRRGGVKGGHARAAALSSEERSAAAKAAADKRWGNEQAEEATKPPATQPAPIIWEPPATTPAQASTPGTRRVEHAIADIVEREAASKVDPPPVAELADRILKAATAQPGTSVPTLAQLLLGGSDQPRLRQIEGALQKLVMRSAVYRANGRVFPSVKSAAAAPAAPKPVPRPVVQVDQQALYNKLIAAYAERNDAPATELAKLLFGEATGLTVTKIKLMTKQLCASERLKRLAYDSWRPWDEKKDRDEDKGDDSDDDEEETELESNGHPDDEEPQELDVG